MRILFARNGPEDIGRTPAPVQVRVVRGVVVAPDQGERTVGLAEEVRAGPEASREAILKAVEQAETFWQSHPPDSSRVRALEHLTGDRKWLSAARATDAAGLAGELQQEQERWVGRVQRRAYLLLGLSMGSLIPVAVCSITGHAMSPLLIAAVGTGFFAGALGSTACCSTVKFPPQVDAMERLLVYQNMAAPRAEVERLAGALGARRGAGIQLEGGQILIGGVAVPRRAPAPQVRATGPGS